KEPPGAFWSPLPKPLFWPSVTPVVSSVVLAPGGEPSAAGGDATGRLSWVRQRAWSCGRRALLKFAAQQASAFAAVNHLQSEALTVSAGARPENPKITHENANTGMNFRIEFPPKFGAQRLNDST